MTHLPTTPATARPPAAASPGQSDGLNWLSWLRVVAIAAVVLIHTAGLTAIAPDARSTAHGRLGIVLDFASRWSVPGFVMMSGALLLDPGRYRGAADFLRRRAWRLVPAIIVWHLVYLIFILLFTDQTMTLALAARLTLTGRLYTALYFFWIVLGLAVATPVLVTWTTVASRRAQLLAGLAAAALPALAVVTVPIRHPGQSWHADVSWVETPWSWWLPYLGYYLLGYALRDVVLRSWRLIPVVLVAVGGPALLCWQWRQTSGVAGWLERYVPAEAYYSPTLIAMTMAVFLLARALIRPGGLLRSLCRPAAAFAGRRLGDATLGVFAVHLLVLQLVLQLPLLGGDLAAHSVLQLLARCISIVVIAYLVSLVASRVPFVRKVF